MSVPPLTADQVVVALNAFTPACFSLPMRVQPALTLAVRTVRLDSPTIEHLGIGDRRPFYTVDLPYLLKAGLCQLHRRHFLFLQEPARFVYRQSSVLCHITPSF